MTVYYAHTHTFGDLKQSQQVPDRDYYYVYAIHLRHIVTLQGAGLKIGVKLASVLDPTIRRAKSIFLGLEYN